MLNKQKIVFMGTPDFALNTLRELENSHEVVCVVTQPDRANKRGKVVTFSPIKEYALSHSLDIFQPEDINSIESIEYLSSLDIDYIIVVAYGQIIGPEIRNLPKKTIVNVHASLLPKYRGAAPIQRSIMNRDLKTGVSIMEVTKGLDKGDVFLTKEVLINNRKLPEVHDDLSKLGADLILEYIEKNELGQIEAVSQDEEIATYAEKIQKEEGKLTFIDLNVEIGKINGLYPKPGAYFEYNGQRVKALEGVAFSNNNNSKSPIGIILEVFDDGILVNCGNGILKITKIQFPGKKEISVNDYLKGNTIEKNIEIG